jgi:hypothetical protein
MCSFYNKSVLTIFCFVLYAENFALKRKQSLLSALETFILLHPGTRECEKSTDDIKVLVRCDNGKLLYSWGRQLKEIRRKLLKRAASYRILFTSSANTSQFCPRWRSGTLNNDGIKRRTPANYRGVGNGDQKH